MSTEAFFTSKVGTDIEALPKMRLLCVYFVRKYLEFCARDVFFTELPQHSKEMFVPLLGAHFQLPYPHILPKDGTSKAHNKKGCEKKTHLG